MKLQEYMCIHQGKMNEEYMCNMICNMCHLDCTTCDLVDLTTLSNSCASVDVLIEPWYEPTRCPISVPWMKLLLSIMRSRKWKQHNGRDMSAVLQKICGIQVLSSFSFSESEG